MKKAGSYGVVALLTLVVWITGERLLARVQDQPEDKGWAVYEIDDLLKKRQESNRAYLSFLNVPTLYTGIYVLPKDGKDGQSPHRHDEIYYVLKGKGEIQMGSGDKQVSKPIKKGSVIYIKAEVEHRFHSIEEDLELLVFFSTKT